MSGPWGIEQAESTIGCAVQRRGRDRHRRSAGEDPRATGRRGRVPRVSGLRIEIVGSQGTEFAYDLSFETVSDQPPEDSVVAQGDLSIIVPAGSVENLTGATLDLPMNSAQGGLVLRNPNRPDPLAGLGDLELTGDVVERVRQLLDEHINPSLAAHGGYATLIGVQEQKAFRQHGWRLPGLRDEPDDAHRGHRGHHHRSGSRDHRGGRRHRPRRWREPLLPLIRSKRPSRERSLAEGAGVGLDWPGRGHRPAMVAPQLTTRNGERHAGDHLLRRVHPVQTACSGPRSLRRSDQVVVRVPGPWPAHDEGRHDDGRRSSPDRPRGDRCVAGPRRVRDDQPALSRQDQRQRHPTQPCTWLPRQSHSTWSGRLDRLMLR